MFHDQHSSDVTTSAVPPVNYDGSYVPDVYLCVFDDQKIIMKAKAEVARELRRREEEKRQRLQKERFSQRLRELEYRLRLKKEHKSGLLSLPSPQAPPIVTTPPPAANCSKEITTGMVIDGPAANGRKLPHP